MAFWLVPKINEATSECRFTLTRVITVGDVCIAGSSCVRQVPVSFCRLLVRSDDRKYDSREGSYAMARWRDATEPYGTVRWGDDTMRCYRDRCSIGL